MLMINYFKTVSGRMERLSAYERDCWIDMVNPSDDEIEDIAALTGIDETLLKAALDEEESRPVSSVTTTSSCASWIPPSSPIPTRATSTRPSLSPFSPTRNASSPVCLRGNPVLGGFVSNRVSADTTRPTSFLLSFMMGNAKVFLSNLRQIDKKSLRVQAELHRSMKNKELIQLLALENSLVYFSTALNATYSVYTKVGRLPSIAENEEYQELFEDILIEAKQAAEMCNIYRDILSGTMDAYASVISNNVNSVMKLLAVITFVIAVPTLIASLWGMNVPVPFEGNVWGFWIVIGIAVVISVVAAVWIVARYQFRAYQDAAPGQAQTPRRRRSLMPLLQYVCPSCGKQFDELVKKFDEKVVCPRLRGGGPPLVFGGDVLRNGQARQALQRQLQDVFGLPLRAFFGGQYNMDSGREARCLLFCVFCEERRKEPASCGISRAEKTFRKKFRKKSDFFRKTLDECL